MRLMVLAFLSRVDLLYWIGHQPARADQAPGRCRAGEDSAWGHGLTGHFGCFRRTIRPSAGGRSRGKDHTGSCQGGRGRAPRWLTMAVLLSHSGWWFGNVTSLEGARNAWVVVGRCHHCAVADFSRKTGVVWEAEGRLLQRREPQGQIILGRSD